MFFFKKIFSIIYLLVKKCFFEKKTSFYLLLIFFTISIFFFWRGKEEGNLVNFQLLKKKFFVLFFNMFFMAGNSPFSSFHNSFCHFPVVFSDLVTEIRWQMTKHVIKRKEWSQWWEWSPRYWKKKSFVGVFLSMTESRSWWTRVNQGDCVRRLDILGKGSATVCFWWLTDLSGTQTACGTPTSEGLSSCSQTSNVRRRSWTKRIKWSVSKIRSCARKTKEMWKGNSMNWKRKQANLQIVEHMSNYHERRVQQGLGEEFKERICQTRDATLARFRSGTRPTKRKWRRGQHEIMRCGNDRRAQMENRTRKEAKWKQRTRRDRSLVKSSCPLCTWCCSRWRKNLSWCHRFSTLPFVMERQIISIWSVQKLWKMTCSNAVQRWSGHCPCRDAEAFSHHS